MKNELKEKANEIAQKINQSILAGMGKGTKISINIEDAGAGIANISIKNLHLQSEEEIKELCSVLMNFREASVKSNPLNRNSQGDQSKNP